MGVLCGGVECAKEHEGQRTVVALGAAATAACGT